MVKVYFNYLVLLSAVLFSSHTGSAQTVVTPAPAISNICVGGAYVPVGTIYIKETNNNDFSSGGAQTYILSVPANFEFNTGVTPTVTERGSDVNTITISPLSSTTFTFTYNVIGTTTIDSLVISGLEVRAITSASSGNIIRSGGTAMQAGNAPTVQGHCALSSDGVSISTHPLTHTACLGGNTNFTVAASGTGLTYFWERDNGGGFVTPPGGTYSGQGTPTLSITGVANGHDGLIFRCTVSSTCGTPVVSNTATLTVVNTPASITTHPANQTKCIGGTATYTVAASNASAYQWEEGISGTYNPVSDGGIYSGANTSTLTLTGVTAVMSTRTYRCVVTNAVCTTPATSNSASLTVTSPSSINTQPVDNTKCAGANASFTISASNTTVYQWEEGISGVYSSISNGGVYSGATSATLTLTGVTTGMSGRTYRCQLSNASCTTPITSNAVTLTVNPATAITTQPTNVTACAGTTPSFTVVASGTGLSFQWQRDRVDGSGFSDAPSPFYSVSTSGNTSSVTVLNAPNGVGTSQNGYLFKCIITGTCGTVTSSTRTLTVYSAGTLSYFGLDGSYCRNSPVDTLTGFPAGGVFSGPGVGTTNLVTGKVAFSPLNAGAGSKTINYTLGCSVPHSTTVNDTTTIAYTSPANANPSYFTTDPPVDLVVETVPPTGPIATGTFSGTGVSGSKFYPALVAVGGPYPILFSYTNPSGCTSKVTKGITVTSPGRSIPVLQAGNPYCQNAPFVLLTHSTVQGGLPFFYPGFYEFDGYSGTGISKLTDTSYRFNPINPGSYVINYNVKYLYLSFNPDFTITSEWRTSVYASQTVTVGAISNIDFYLPTEACNTNSSFDLTPFPGVLSGGSGTNISIISPASYPAGLLTGTTFNPSAVTTSTLFTVRYTYYNASGCPTILDKQINIFTKPSPPILATGGANSPQNYEVCLGNSLSPWSVIPVNTSSVIKWYDNSGLNNPVNSTSYTAPLSTGTPATKDYYVTETLSGCISDPLTVTLTIRDKAFVNAGTDQAKCMGASYTLSGISEKEFSNSSLNASWIGGLGTFSPGTNSLNAVYTPHPSELPTPGGLATTVSLTLRSDYPDGPTGPCPYAEDIVVLTINPSPVVNAVIVPKVSFCKSDPEALLNVQITSKYAGTGVYSDTSIVVPGVAGDFFYPVLGGIGAHNIYYKYTDINGCSAYNSTLVNIYGSPKIKFTIADYCATRPTFFDASATDIPNDLSSSIIGYKWNFGDFSTEADTSLLSSDYYTYKKTLDPLARQGYQVKLNVVTDKGCSSVKDTSITIGNVPGAEFKWNKICPADVATSFIDLSSFPSPEVAQYTWNFDDGSAPNTTDQNPMHKMANGTGAYNVTYTISSIRGCDSTITHKVNILDEYRPTPIDPYNTSFVSSDALYWSVDGQNPSWAWGSANKTNITTGSRNVWVTNTSGPYNVNEKSYLNGPCLNFDTLSRPMAVLKIWSATQSQIAGAVLQSSTDGGTTWNVVGSLTSGVNWYDHSAVLGNPGNQPINQFGWTGQYPDWKIAKVSLNNLAGSSTVRLRLAFGSGQDTLNLQDGFAIDSIWIGDRDKLLLVENFTNSSSASAATADASLNALIDSRANDVVAIHYHTGFPGSDPMNLRNQANPSSRVLHYGVPSVPYKVFDGNYDFTSTAGGTSAAFDTADIDRRSLDAAKFAIKLNTTITSDSVTAKVNIIAKDSVNNDFVVHIAVIERNAVVNSNTYQWVLARMLPNAAGTFYNQTFYKNDSASIVEHWHFLPGEVYDPSQLGVIVFIQDIVTKEIYQTAYQPGSGGPLVTTGLKNQLLSGKEIFVYPNPSDNTTSILFEGSPKEEYSYQIYDELGKVADQGIVEPGNNALTINTSAFASGLYVIRIGNDKEGFAYKKLMVVH